MREVKRHARAGEYIKITNCYDSRYDDGDIFRVEKSYEKVKCVSVLMGNIDVIIDDCEYVVLENYDTATDYSIAKFDNISKIDLGIDTLDATRYCIEDFLETAEKVYKIGNEEGMINMNKVLELYKGKHECWIKKEFDKIRKEEYENLEVVKQYNDMIKEFEDKFDNFYKENEIVEDKIFELVSTDNVFKYVPNNRKLMISIENKHRDEEEQELKELHDLVEEVNAQLSMSDDVEYQRQILKDYGIIDKKTGKIN